MTRMGIVKLSLLATCCACLVVATPPAASAALVGSEFQVNTFTTGYQYEPAVAGASAGNFVVVWQSYPQLGATAGSDIFAQRFGTDGAKAGGEFQVNGVTAGYQYYPHVAMRDNGDFVVVWTNGSGDGDGPGISARRFNAAGQALGSEFQVNSASAGYQYDPRVALDASGNMTVVWWTSPSTAAPQPDGNQSGVFARRFDSSGTPVAGQFQVNQLTTGEQSFPDLRYDANGNIVIAWQSEIGRAHV